MTKFCAKEVGKEENYDIPALDLNKDNKIEAEY
jgi:hypothetical protein